MYLENKDITSSDLLFISQMNWSACDNFEKFWHILLTEDKIAALAEES